MANKAIGCHKSFLKVVLISHCWRTMTKHIYSMWKSRKRRRKSIFQGSFICMVSTDNSTHPLSFIRRAGCYSSLGFPERCKLLVHTIEPAMRVWALEAWPIKSMRIHTLLKSSQNLLLKTHIYSMTNLSRCYEYTQTEHNINPIYGMNRSHVERHPNLKSSCYEYITY